MASSAPQGKGSTRQYEVPGIYLLLFIVSIKSANTALHYVHLPAFLLDNLGKSVPAR